MILATTILAVLRAGTVTLAGDGQVTIGDMVMKHSARKIRKLYKERVLAGFAGAVADALTLFEKFESQLERNKGNLRKSAVDLTKEWRTDRYLRRLEAQLIVAAIGAAAAVERKLPVVVHRNVVRPVATS